MLTIISTAHCCGHHSRSREFNVESTQNYLIHIELPFAKNGKYERVGEKRWTNVLAIT